MNTISISVKVKGELQDVKLILYNKTYLTSKGIVDHWFTANNCKYRLEIIVDDSDSYVNPSKVSKDMNIVTDEWKIAEQVMLRLNKKDNVAGEIVQNDFLKF